VTETIRDSSLDNLLFPIRMAAFMGENEWLGTMGLGATFAELDGARRPDEDALRMRRLLSGLRIAACATDCGGGDCGTL